MQVVEKELGRKLKNWEMQIVKKKKTSDTAIDELYFINENGGLNDAQAKKYVQLLDKGIDPMEEDIKKIKSQ